MAKPIRIGLVGTGIVSRLHLPAFQQYPEDVQLVAVCDTHEEAANQFAKDANVDRVYTDFEKMLREADIDAVDICTIHNQHEYQAIAAAEAGKHILLEKPMAASLEECRNILTATDNAGIIFMVAQTLRYLPQSRIVHRMIHEGELGPIWMVRSDDLLSTIPSRSEIPATIEPSVPTHWIYDGNQSGGGALITLTTHHIDLFRYYLGNVKRVTGTCRTDHPMFFNGAEDRAHAILEFENGAVGNLFSSFTIRSPWMHRYWVFGETGTVCSVPKRDGNGLEHLHAPVEVSSLKHGEVQPHMHGSKFMQVNGKTVSLPSDKAFINEILHFAACCREGKEPISSGKDNLGTMKVVFGIYESAKTGKPVDLDTI